MLIALLLSATTPSVSIADPAMQVEARRAMAAYAACVVAKHGPAVEALLAQPYDDRVSKASRDLHDADCPLATATGSTTFRQNLLRGFDGLGFRGVLFQALVARDRAKLSDTVADPGEAAFAAGRMWPGSPAAAYREWIGMGRCVIGRDPSQARALAMSAAGSADEAVAFAALAQPLGKCGWRKGDVALMRGSLSEIVYRATIGPTAAIATAGNR